MAASGCRRRRICRRRTAATQFIATLEVFGRVFLAEFLHPDRMAMYRLAIAEARAGRRAVARELDAGGRLPVVQSVTRYFEQAAARGLVRREDMRDR